MIMASCSCIYVFLVSNVECGSSKDDWDIFTLDSLSLTMDFEGAEKLSSIFGPNCNSSDLFEFEVDWDELVLNALNDKTSSVSNDYDSITSTREKRSKVLIITICSMIAVLAVVALFIYGKSALISYLQSGTYNITDKGDQCGFHELPEVTLRKN